MDPRIAPASSLGSAILAALQSPQGEPQIQALLALVGENLDLLLLSAEDGTATLRMPGGQVFAAEGELPYPAGTRLTVQVQAPLPEQSAPRLKLVEAKPPPPAPILAPLAQGEGVQLLARLQSPQPPPELGTMLRLLAGLGAEKPPAAAAPPAAELPSPGRIAEWLRGLPPESLGQLQRNLLPQATGSVSTAELAQAVGNRLAARNSAAAPPPTPAADPVGTKGPIPPADPLQQSPKPVPPADANPTGLRRTPDPLEAPASLPGGIPAAVPQGLLLPGPQPWAASSPAPPPAGTDPVLKPLEELLRLLIGSAREPEDAEPVPSGGPARPGPAPPDPQPRKPTQIARDLSPSPPEPGPVGARTPPERIPSGRTGEPPGPPPDTSKPAAAAPEPAAHRPGTIPARNPPATAGTESPAASPTAWASWLQEAVKVLSDPLASPREAPFHLAQAKEGTALFEIPLPWEAAGQVLQMWVEADGGQGSGGNRERTARVLVGLQFSALGETRVGVVRSGPHLQVRVWAERPDPLKSREAQLRSDLADLGPDLDFQILPLGESGAAFPSLRALAAGTGFQALG